MNWDNFFKTGFLAFLGFISLQGYQTREAVVRVEERLLSVRYVQDAHTQKLDRRGEWIASMNEFKGFVLNELSNLKKENS